LISTDMVERAVLRQLMLVPRLTAAAGARI
jgi:hypothetical protein